MNKKKREFIIQKETVLCVNSCGYEGALAKVIDLGHQVIITFLERDDEHLTLHKQQDSSRLLLTHYYKNMQSRSGLVKVEIAKQCGYTYPERHAHYMVHQEVFERLKTPYISLCSEDSELVERLVPIISIGMSFGDCRIPIPSKYSEIPKVTLSVNSMEFFLSVYFTKDEAEFKDVPLVPITTSLGYVSFSTEKESPFGGAAV